MTSRREAIVKLFKTVTLAGSGGLLWANAAKGAISAPFALRPPGALHTDDFIKACIKCGQCVSVCPYDTLKLGTPGDDKAIGTPFFIPREIPCYMCTDYPCTEICPSGALDLKEITETPEKPNINNAQMGLAVIHKETCIAFWGIQCDACYRACPLMGTAITLKMEKSEVTGKHASLKPIVNSDICTGCGMCEHACIVDKAAIFILPRDKATGEVSNHYIKGWDKSDEERIKNQFGSEGEENTKSTLDYLNEDKEFSD
ncbi:MAG: ferredoxin-type protein NapG [Bacteroidetes bacterium 4572_117]|nr:MAG: ferredoxin-type protein NapG [Bacteroidetes bacterium 4572_117]